MKFSRRALPDAEPRWVAVFVGWAPPTTDKQAVTATCLVVRMVGDAHPTSEVGSVCPRWSVGKEKQVGG